MPGFLVKPWSSCSLKGEQDSPRLFAKTQITRFAQILGFISKSAMAL